MTPPTQIEGIPELKRYIGVPLGTTEWVEISQETISGFAEVTGDRQWIHTDVERARRESPFGETIAHGYLTVAQIPVLLPELLLVSGVSMVVNSGIDKVRLQAPVPAGGRICLSAEIKNVRELPSGAARVVIGFRFDVEDGTKPACTGEVVYVYYP
jgi:acyl dehydratase